MKRLALALVATTLALGLGACSPGEAACAAVTADIPATARAGEAVDIEVADLFATCNDQGKGANQADDTVTLSLVVPRANDEPLASATAPVNADGSSTVSLLVPQDATGTLAVMLGDDELGTLTVTD